MKKTVLIFACLLLVLTSFTASAAVNKVVITTTEPTVGAKPSTEASVPETASTEVYEVRWSGEFDKGVFVQGNDYTMTVKLRIKASSSNTFSTTSSINVTINSHKAKVTSVSAQSITVKYTWKTLGGENPNSPAYKLKARLAELASAYHATNATNDKELLKYIKSELKDAEIWSAPNGSYAYVKKMPTDINDGYVSVYIGVKQGEVTLDRYTFKVILPALNKSSYATNLNEDLALMKKALDNLIATSETTGDDILTAVNAAAIHGTKAEWGENYTYKAPTTKFMGSIDGNLIIALGDSKDLIRAHKSLPIKGDSADAAVDADFSRLSHALHNYTITNRTTKDELLQVANAAIQDGSTLTCTNFIKTEATYVEEGKIVMYFDLENKGKIRNPRISMKIGTLKAVLPPELAVTQNEWQVVRMTNIERFKKELTLLAMASPLQDAAHIRAKESSQKYSHTRPDGTYATTAIDPQFIVHRTAGENLNGGDNPVDVMEGWMKSPAHRANILKDNYCYIGVGEFGTVHKVWVQLFVGDCGVIKVESSTGSLVFDSVEEMENAYLICDMAYTTKAYIPLDVDYMTKEGNKYTLCLRGKTVTVTVRDGSNEVEAEVEKGASDSDDFYEKISKRASVATIETMVGYGPNSGNLNGHQWVDLGLPSGTRWATCNVDATSPEQSGKHYSWGEVATKSSYLPGTTKTYNVKMNDISGNKTYDVATLKWGKGWRMPTEREMTELLRYCDDRYVQKGGRYGREFTSVINGKSIFLPATGSKNGSKLSEANGCGLYWASTPSSDNGAHMYTFGAALGYVTTGDRAVGMAIRAVCDYDVNTDIPFDGETDGHKWVDLGLPSGIKWATCNVGSDAVDQDGIHFKWGSLEKYGSNSTYAKSDVQNDISGDVRYDAARAQWGGSWCMPSAFDFVELIENCTFEWTSIGRRKGVKVTSKINGKYIFLPASGKCNYNDSDGLASDINKALAYWTSTPMRGWQNVDDAYYFTATSTDVFIVSKIRYQQGWCIRPVMK